MDLMLINSLLYAVCGVLTCHLVQKDPPNGWSLLIAPFWPLVWLGKFLEKIYG